jgi:CheY-like chemotaxis protein/HPt (histidine-containing phosphotransfer) domain-containing protein
VESEPGNGSTFHFTTRFGLQAEGKSRTAVLDPAMLQGISILIVDDNATSRQVLQDMVTHWGMKAAAVADAGEALRGMKQALQAGNPPALVLLDAHLPAIDGFTLTQEIIQRNANPGTAFILLTSSGQRGDALRCQKMGIDAYLTKPVQPSELQAALLATLRSKGASPPPQPLVTRHSITENQRQLDKAREIKVTEPLQILLVEDNAVNQKVALKLLEKWGHQVEIAATGLEAVEKYSTLKFDVILMDIQMPGMNGLEATMRIREMEKTAERRTPIIAMTAHAMKGDRERCLESGMDDYVPKPIDAWQLAEAIARASDSALANISAELLPAGVVQAPLSVSLLPQKELMARVDGDADLLKDLARLFLADYPNVLAQIEDSLAIHDLHSLEKAAQMLKGAMANFCGREVVLAVSRLQELARAGDLRSATETLVLLKQGIDCLQPSVQALSTGELFAAARPDGA